MEIKITIDGKEYSVEELRKLKAELDKLFAPPMPEESVLTNGFEAVDSTAYTGPVWVDMSGSYNKDFYEELRAYSAVAKRANK